MTDKYFYLEVIDHKDINVWYSSMEIDGAECHQSLDSLLESLIDYEIHHEEIKNKMALMIEAILLDASIKSINGVQS